MTSIAATLSRRPGLAHLAEGILLLVSIGGFWLWSHTPPEAGKGIATAYLLGLGIAPMILVVYIGMKRTAGVERMMATRGFQSRIDQMQQRINARDDFFRSVADYMPSSFTIFDEHNQYWFVNAAAARMLGRAQADITGKTPVALLGGEQGRRVEKHLDAARTSGRRVETLIEGTDDAGQARFVQASFLPLAASGDFPGGVLAREEDITAILQERQRRENMLRQVISTLVAVVDRRDPYASGHSARTGQLSRAIAEELRLTAAEIEAAEIAGSLMNFGKVLVSRAILTKTDSLTQTELQRIRDGILTSADILSLIEFNAPVVPTLRQVLERHDGAGAPFGLKGDAILMTARIVAAANAFVALVSPRAYRPGAEFTVAVQRMSEDAGKAFDPRVIEALRNFIGRNGGNLDWLAAKRV